MQGSGYVSIDYYFVRCPVRLLALHHSDPRCIENHILTPGRVAVVFAPLAGGLAAIGAKDLLDSPYTT